MDPNETLSALRLAVASHDPHATEELFDALDSWIANGGFLPTDWAQQ